MTTYIYKGSKATINFEIDLGLSTNYEEALDLLHPDIKWIHRRIGLYQGDVISLGYDSSMNFYYKNNSYGSCSRCDWVQGISSEQEATAFYKKQEVLDSLGNDKEKVKSYLTKEINNVWDFNKEDLDYFINFLDKLKGI